jgi:hypothetical protein
MPPDQTSHPLCAEFPVEDHVAGNDFLEGLTILSGTVEHFVLIRIHAVAITAGVQG